MVSTPFRTLRVKTFDTAENSRDAPSAVLTRMVAGIAMPLRSSWFANNIFYVYQYCYKTSSRFFMFLINFCFELIIKRMNKRMI